MLATTVLQLVVPQTKILYPLLPEARIDIRPGLFISHNFPMPLRQVRKFDFTTHMNPIDIPLTLNHY